MNIITKEISWLMYTMLLFYVIPGVVAGVMYLFPTKREMAAKRHLERNQRRHLATT